MADAAVSKAVSIEGSSPSGPTRDIIAAMELALTNGLQITLDENTGATYIYLRGPIVPGGVKFTSVVAAGIHLDWNVDHEAIGIEILPVKPEGE